MAEWLPEPYIFVSLSCKGLLKQPKTIIKKIIRQQTPMRGMGVFTMELIDSFNYVAHYDLFIVYSNRGYSIIISNFIVTKII